MLASVHIFGPLPIGPVAGASALGEAQVVAQHGLLSDVARRRDRRLGRPDLIHFGRGHRYRTSARRVCRNADLELHRCEARMPLNQNRGCCSPTLTQANEHAAHALLSLGF